MDRKEQGQRVVSITFFDVPQTCRRMAPTGQIRNNERVAHNVLTLAFVPVPSWEMTGKNRSRDAQQRRGQIPVD
ncbi:hypothetical protein PISMIDRAFT_685431 [Pisolithus microcarpus 441]|uniref:Uncharacterized protein n=1 Tax=Pisolithus microcarpus 441 TaxID=765257 RepID=A0A0C9Z4B4_9AGAM|nr:hypothetical protein PISMIDRAFT_685431 [Pisolithus microcarpus 441]